jgi:exonuclease SbcC
MTPLRISLEGFMSYRERQTFDFDGAPLWVLAGPNGAGKSAVFEAITVALYGRYRGKGKANKDLIHHDADALVVEFDFLLDGEAFRLRRTISHRGRPTYAAFRLISTNSGGEARVEPIPEAETESGLKAWVNRKIGLSYETFISSVLLMQGRSEELLNADPRDRYRVLSELIDLSLYQQLHKRAEDLRKQHESQAKLLSQQLKSAPAIIEEELEAARQAVEQTEAEWQVAQARVDESTRLLEQARQWERSSGELDACRNKAQQAQALLEREPEITSGYERLRQLEQVLPDLDRILALRERLVAHEQTLSRLNQDIVQAEPEIANVDQARLAAEADVARLEAEIDESQRNLRALTARLSELAPLLQQLDQWEKTQAEAQRLKTQMAALPPDLPQLLSDAETRERELNEITRALPWLKQLAQTRSALARSRQESQLAQTELEELSGEFNLETEKLAQLKDDIEAAQDAERALAQDAVRAETRHQDACRHRDRFSQAATQPTCELCGQEITPTHAEVEKQRLAEQASTAEARLEEVIIRHQQAEMRLQELEGSFAEQSQILKSLDQRRNQIQTLLGNSRRDADSHLKQLENTFTSLPPAFQDRVRSSGASVDLSTTSYPTSDDLSALAKEAAAQQAHAQHLQRLRKQSEAWQRLDAQLQAAERQLVNLGPRERLTEALEARDEQRKLEAQLKELDAIVEQSATGLKRAKRSADQCRTKAEDLGHALARHKADAQAAQATCEEIVRNIQGQIAALPDIWRPHAETLNQQMLREIEAERDKLREYETLFSDLSQARQSLNNLEQRTSDLKAQIADLPLPARRAAVEIEREIKTAQSQRDASDTHRQETRERFMKLEEQQRHHLQLEQQYLISERALNLYKILAQLLGPDGLQLTLLRRAERTITALANEILDGLSRGQMRMELRGAEGTEELSEKALDLVVYNYETGTQPLPVALVSGSQRFRIAVSLALAVGRYAGEEARAIESVIIDEGFGCLDTNGRDDMIQELNRLQEQLSRILLVSHQEEFARAFSNGYAIALVDGASQISLR